jgi:uncharacterized membrane protein YfcA
MNKHIELPSDKSVVNNNFNILVIGESESLDTSLAKLRAKSVSLHLDFLQASGATKSNFKAHERNGPASVISEEHLQLSQYNLVLISARAATHHQDLLDNAREIGVLVSVPDGDNASKHKVPTKVAPGEKYWRSIASKCLFALAFIIVGQLIASFYPLQNLYNGFKAFAGTIELDSAFGWMLLAGFVAQLVDGALGMGYGVISTTVLLSTGLNPAAISGSIHTAEMFSSGASGFSHYKFGNINKKLFKTLLLPGVLGAVVGAVLLCYLGESYGSWLRPVLSAYTLLLGARILFNAFKKKNESRKVKHAGWLAGAGGFLDSFGGGGWGPLVTSTLISKGKTPRYIIGTVSLTEFFVTLGSALTFFLILGASHIQTIAGLIIGGLLAAPIAARFAGKMKTKSILIAVGTLVIISSLRTLLKTAGVF